MSTRVAKSYRRVAILFVAFILAGTCVAMCSRSCGDDAPTAATQDSAPNTRPSIS